MASRVLGVDLGAYSVKVVVSTPGFRGAQVSEVIEQLVPEGEEPHLVRAARVAGGILANYRGGEDSVYASIAGDKVFLHVLEFGFKNLRRAELQSAVGAELEGVLPIDLEDMVYAFEQIPKVPMPEGLVELAAEDETTVVGDLPVAKAASAIVHGRVAEAVVGMRILGAATLRSRAEEFLVALRAEGVDPRGLLAAPAPYARLAEKLVASGEAVAVLDIGHMRTDFCLATGGHPIFARTMARGGHHMTRALSKAWNVDYQRAEVAKHSDGYVAPPSLGAPTEAAMQISDILQGEAKSLTRDLKRTINACRAKTGFTVERIVVVGGGSRLRGLPGYLAENLGLPVEQLRQEAGQALLGAAASSAALDTCALAVGVAMDGASAKPSFDLRQGALAFKADSSFLRSKVRTLATAAVAIMAFGVLSAYTGVSKLRAAEATLKTRVALESAAALGEQLSAADVLHRVGPVENNSRMSPVPSMTAYDMLMAFNAALPKKDKAVLDVTEVDIQSGKLVVEASSSQFEETSALQGIKNLEASLKASDCFKDFMSPESQPGKNDSRTFTLTIKSGCNKKE
ncbi:MAG: pilus assembly protein PilM [Myxococcales bacterium]|nr:pilus assembly protein PilM [Myxococcales bacterium]